MKISDMPIAIDDRVRVRDKGHKYYGKTGSVMWVHTADGEVYHGLRKDYTGSEIYGVWFSRPRVAIEFNRKQLARLRS